MQGSNLYRGGIAQSNCTQKYIFLFLFLYIFLGTRMFEKQYIHIVGEFSDIGVAIAMMRSNENTAMAFSSTITRLR